MKFFKWLLIVVLIVGALLFGAFQIMKMNTKKASPESEVVMTKNNTEVKVFYNRPSKRGRRIFGDLVPYNQVWRTGANEATTFSTTSDLLIMGQKLPKGEYTLWTIPGKISWEVIWNSKQYPWGVNWESQASREAQFDVLNLDVPVSNLSKEIEMFTISLEKSNPNLMRLEWEKTGLVIPFIINGNQN